MVSSVVDQYDDLLDTCLNSDPSVDGADTCSHYYVNSCDLDQSSRDSQVSCVEACVTDRFAATMKGVRRLRRRRSPPLSLPWQAMERPPAAARVQQSKA